MGDWCPWVKGECDSWCRFRPEGKCLIVEFLEFQIIQAKITMGWAKQMVPMFEVMRKMYRLPEEVKEQLPEDLKGQIEDIFRNLEGRQDSA